MTVLEKNIHDAAMNADDLGFFRGYLRGLLDSERLSSGDLQTVLKVVYEDLHEQGDEAAADLVLDGLDLLTGWSGPTAYV